MGSPESAPRHPAYQDRGRRKGLGRRPRSWRCMLKGCGQRFRPRRARQRYCRERCWCWKRHGSGRFGRHRRAIGHDGGQRKTERGKPSLPGTRQESETTSKRSRSGRCEVNHSESFSDVSCDRPGCYAGFARRRRSPLEHFYSHERRRVRERVWERERHWHRNRAG